MFVTPLPDNDPLRCVICGDVMKEAVQVRISRPNASQVQAKCRPRPSHAALSCTELRHAAPEWNPAACGSAAAARAVALGLRGDELTAKTADHLAACAACRQPKRLGLHRLILAAIFPTDSPLFFPPHYFSLLYSVRSSTCLADTAWSRRWPSSRSAPTAASRCRAARCSPAAR